MITITEILGTDSLSSSRITINNNFNTLKSEVNRLAKYVNNSTIGGSVYDVECKTLKIGSTILDEATLIQLINSLNEE